MNLLVVFFLCGLWHGANVTFVVWGLYHGLFLVLERTAWGAAANRLPRPARHAYALLVVVIGWVIFRSADFAGCAQFLQAMAGLGGAPEAQPWMRYATGPVIAALVLGVAYSVPWTAAEGVLARRLAGRPGWATVGCWLNVAAQAGLLLLDMAWLAGETYNPFIYFRF